MGQTTSKHFTMSDGVSIHAILTEGSEDSLPQATLLCISGFGCSHYNFIEMAKDLGDQYRMVLIDNRGMGQSSDSPKDYDLEILASDALEVMNQLGVDTFHLAGISMGGFVSQLLVKMAPQRVQSLSLLCTSSGGSDFVALPPMTEENLTQFYQLPEPKRTEIAIEATVHPKLKENNFGRFQNICELRRAHPVRVDQVLMQKRAVDKFLSTNLDLSEIRCPTYILTGDSDRFVSPKNAHLLQQRISGSKLFSVDETDHLFFLEHPRKVAEIMKTNLKEVVHHNNSQEVSR
jgi:3-oxoadipate enol-lactonase